MDPPRSLPKLNITTISRLGGVDSDDDDNDPVLIAWQLHQDIAEIRHSQHQIMSKVAQLQTSDNDTRAMISDWCGEMNTEMIRIKNQMGDVRDGFIRFLSALSKETATEVSNMMTKGFLAVVVALVCGWLWFFCRG